MKIIVITLPDHGVENEPDRISAMLESGLIDRVHIRKPEMQPKDMSRLISNIPQELHKKLSIHSNPELLREFTGIGWHFSATRHDAACTGLRSRSCHSPAEAADWADRCDYVTLSPVFDSISKPGYLSAGFMTVEECLSNRKGNVVALGGVSPEKIPLLKERGYIGAAMLGYAWKTDFNRFIEELKCYNS